MEQKADTPNGKLKILQADLKVEKDKNYKLKETIRNTERNSIKTQEYMVKLEQKVRKLNAQLQEKRGDQEDY